MNKPLFFKLLLLNLLTCLGIVNLTAQCSLNNPESWAWIAPTLENDDCCVSHVEAYEIDETLYFLFPYDVANCPEDGPQYTYIYDCEGVEVCYTESLSGENSCADINFELTGDGVTIWENTCTTDPCVHIDLINPNQGCDDVYAPVCGCNGITYENECVAEVVGGITEFINGPCESILEIVDDFYTMSYGDILSICPLNNDIIPNGFAAIQYTPVINLSTIDSPCTEFIPSEEGEFLITYTVCDIEGNCGEGTITILVGDPTPIECTTNCVWPGDANYDGVANNYDLLPIGLLYGSTGLARTNASIEWTAQFSNEWIVQVPQTNINTDSVALINGKHSDCDGNGTIDNNDVFAITENYGMIHPKSSEVTELVFGPSLSLQIQETNIAPNSWVNVDIHLDGENEENIEDFYGIAFQVDYYNEYEGEPILIPDSLTTDLVENNWIDNNGNDLVLTLVQDLHEIDSTMNQLDIAISRTNQEGVDGTGIIGSFAVFVKDLEGETASIPLNFSIKNALMVYENGTTSKLETATTNTQVQLTGIQELPKAYEQQAKLFPNPAKDRLTLSIPETKIEQVQLLNITGQTIKHFTGLDNQEITINVAGLADGIYYLKIQTNKGLLNRKIEIIH